NKDGDLFKGLFRGHDGKCVSVYFRVEEIFDNCCATLRVLIPLKKDRTTVVKIMNNGKIDYEELCSVRHWPRSNSCITVHLHCFCAVQCFADVDFEICDYKLNGNGENSPFPFFYSEFYKIMRMPLISFTCNSTISPWEFRMPTFPSPKLSRKPRALFDSVINSQAYGG